METTGSNNTEDGMTGTDAVDYLGLQDACQEWVQRDADLTIIEFAEDRGYYPGEWLGLTIEYAQAQAGGIEGYDDYHGDLDVDLHNIALEAIEHLIDTGILPKGYGQRTPSAKGGYGLLPTDGEGS